MKPTIYTGCQAIPKDIYDCDADLITKQVEKSLKNQVVDAMITALGSGEQVVTLYPVTTEENERYHVIEMRQYIQMTPLIRCKDCKHQPYTSDEYDYDNGDCGFEIIFPDYCCPCRCEDEYYNRLPDDDWYCGNAERKTGG